MAKNRYIRDRYVSRDQRRPAPRQGSSRTLSLGSGIDSLRDTQTRKKMAFLLISLGVLVLAVFLILGKSEDAAPPQENDTQAQARAYETALQEEILAVAEDDYATRARLFQELLALDPDNEEYRAGYERYNELHAEAVHTEEQELLRRASTLAQNGDPDLETLVMIYSRLAELRPDNAEYEAQRLEYQQTLHAELGELEQELYAQVLEVPAEDWETNMAFYARLMELNPDKDLYRERHEHYAAQGQEERRLREQRLLNQVLQVPVDDYETNMLFYKELMELNPDNSTYREKHGHYAARWEEQRAALEQELFQQVRQVPADDYETNMVLYEQLMDLNPAEPLYREKYEYYLVLYYESQGIEPPRLDSPPGDDAGEQ